MGLTVLIFGFNVYRVAMHQNDLSRDFSLYAQFVSSMKQRGSIVTPHFIYPLLVLLVSYIVPVRSYAAIGAGIVLAFQLLFATVCWNFWRTQRTTNAPLRNAPILTLMVMLVTPITIVTPLHQYFGYIGITIYHNPTMLIARPIALIHFLIFCSVLTAGKYSTRQLISSVLLIVVVTLMKPNYTLIVIPAATLLILFAWRRRNVPQRNFMLLGVLVPGACVLLWQFLFTYLVPNSFLGSSGIEFAPLLVYNTVSDTVFFKFLLSILFPLSMLIIWRKEALSSNVYIFSFLLFLFGSIEAYGFAERGSRVYDGNLLWSAQFGLFFWFLISMKLAYTQLSKNGGRLVRSPKFGIALVAFFLHLSSGLLWYFHETQATGMYW